MSIDRSHRDAGRPAPAGDVVATVQQKHIASIDPGMTISALVSGIRLFRFLIVRCRAGPAQGCAVPPILPTANSALARAGITNARQNRLPRAPLRGATGVLDPAQPGIVRTSCLQNRR